MKLKIVLHPEEDGRFTAEVPGFGGCVSWGHTAAEALANVREAFEGVLEVMQETAAVHPDDRTCGDRVTVIEV